MKTEECPECHKKLKVKEIIDEYSVIEECKYCNKEFKITYDEETFPDNLKSFNWGAFLVTGIWALGNGTYYLAFLYLALCSMFPYSYPVMFVLSLYYGFNGSRLSWIKKNWSSIGSFERAQGLWLYVGILISFVNIMYILSKL